MICFTTPKFSKNQKNNMKKGASVQAKDRADWMGSDPTARWLQELYRLGLLVKLKYQQQMIYTVCLKIQAFKISPSARPFI